MPALPQTHAKALAAELVILEEFDLIRRWQGHDYGAGQRVRERRRYRHTLEGCDVPTVTPPEELLAAFERLAGPRRARIAAESYRARTPSTQATLRAWRLLEQRVRASQPKQTAGIPD